MWFFCKVCINIILLSQVTEFYFFQFPDDTAIFFLCGALQSRTLCVLHYILPNIKSGVLCWKKIKIVITWLGLPTQTDRTCLLFCFYQSKFKYRNGGDEWIASNRTRYHTFKLSNLSFVHPDVAAHDLQLWRWVVHYHVIIFFLF